MKLSLPNLGKSILGFAITASALEAETVVPSRTEWKDGKLSVVFPLADPLRNPLEGGGANILFLPDPTPTTLGKIYRVERSLDNTNWTSFPGTIYGFGQIARYIVADAPFPTQQILPPTNEARPAVNLDFMVTAFPDGSAVASWTGLDGSQQKAYLPDLNLVYQGQVMQEFISGIIPPDGPGSQPYGLSVWSWSSSKNDPVANLEASPSEQPTLLKLISQVTWVRNQMTAKVDWKLANPGLAQPAPAKLFDDKGQPTREMYRVVESTTDSNFDGITDDQQFTNGLVFNMDLDNDGIPNGYDRDLWPAAIYPTLNSLLSSVLINEVLMSNDHTVDDEDSSSQDYVELYNPTNTAMDISGWYLSDSASTGGRTKWSFPAGTIIPSGQFLVIWASGKNRRDPYAPLHTSFSFSAGSINPFVNPEPVVLSKPNPAGGTAIIVDSFVPGTTANFGPQRTDVAFGRYPTSEGLKTGYLIKPTPGQYTLYGPYGLSGEHNVTGANGFTDMPSFASSSSNPGLYENTTVQAALLPPSSGGTVYFTTNSSTPSRYSEIYSAPLATNRTQIIRAIAVKDGYLPSSPITRSFLFKEDILGTAPSGIVPTDQQGSTDSSSQMSGTLRGYPQKTSDPDHPLLYRMDAATVAAHRSDLSQELNQVPIVSIVCPVPEFFDYEAGGLYANSDFTTHSPDPLHTGWERQSSFEFVEPNRANYKQTNIVVTMTGNTSLWHDLTVKHNLRIKFKDDYAVRPLDYQVFNDFSKTKFEQLHLKNTTQDSWSNTWFENLYYNNEEYTHRDIATYCNEAWGKSVHKAMGNDGTYFRWVHLFINGIYWGPHQLTERVDDDFMRLHETQNGLYTYDVIRQGEIAMAGDLTAWQDLKIQLNNFKIAPEANKLGLFQSLSQTIDINNYIDYLLVHWYCNVNDWGSNNWRAARKREGGLWKFFIWDTEFSFQPGQQTTQGEYTYSSLDEMMSKSDEVMMIHDAFKDYSPYKTAFSLRIKKHFFVDTQDSTSGCLAVVNGADRAVAIFDEQMTKFNSVVHSESARWGYMSKTIPYGKDSPTYLPGKTFGDWSRATNYVKNTWLPQRRPFFFTKMQQAGLYQP